MNIEVNKRYYHTATKDKNGVCKININVTKYYYEVKIDENYFEYENIDDLKENIISDLEKAKTEIVKKIGRL